MIKKSLIQGLFLLILLYIIIFFFNIAFGIRLMNEFIFSVQGMLVFYVFIAIGVLMFMRI